MGLLWGAIQYSKNRSKNKSQIAEERLSVLKERVWDQEKEILVTLNMAMRPFSLKVNPKPTNMVAIDVLEEKSNIYHRVDLGNQSCTCEEFTRRAELPFNDLRRWCKHIMRAMHMDNALAHENDWIKAIAKDGYHAPIAARLFERQTTGLFLFAVGTNKEWVNIYARTKRSKELVSEASGEITRFGWNMKQKNWAWGIAPPGARELKELIRAIGWIEVK